MMSSDESIKTHPVQRGYHLDRDGAKVPAVVTMRAYEVYCALFREQPALVTGDCRGGFGAGELVAFLYARSFPQEQWRMRFDEALRGMKNL